MFKKLCEPAKLYLLFTVIFIVMSVFNGITALTVIVKFVFALIWTLVLNWLCSKGFTGLAWIIVLMPFIFLFLTVFAVKDSFQNSRDSLSLGIEPFFDEEEDPEEEEGVEAFGSGTDGIKASVRKRK